MTGAMYAAIGGLKTHMTNLNVIGNNIANVNTPGYKAQRMIFQESIYTTSRAGSNGTAVRGGNTPSQIGYGSQVGSIDLNMSPGTFNPTGVGMDCMLEGDGFFLLGNKDLKFDSAEDYTKLSLTRVGDFSIDAMGYVTDGNKNVVYGFKMVQNPDYKPDAKEQYEIDNNGNKINVMDKLIPSTELVPLRVPFAATAPTKENGGYDDTTKEYAWQAGDAVYDLLGPAGADSTARKNYSLMDAEYNEDTGALEELDDGIGQPADRTSGETTGKLDYKGPLPDMSGKLISLNGLQINSNGAIIGTAESGESVVIGYAAIGKVTAPDGVTHIGGPYYKAMEGAGEMTVGVAGGLFEPGTYLNNQRVTDNGAPGIKDMLDQNKENEIRNGGLESSTADVATEFSNMIVTQRGYQANTRIVTVTDSMLEELVNMKR